LLNNRIQAKENLFKKKVTDNDTCEVCSQEIETAWHIMFGCPFAKVFWELLQVQTNNINSVEDIHMLARPENIPAAHFDGFVTLCCRLLWKRRNELVFQREAMTMRRFLNLCSNEAQLWSCRLPVETRSTPNVWCSLFTTIMNQGSGANQSNV